MMSTELQTAFESIGAELQLETRGRAFEIDVRRRAGRELFALRYPFHDVITAEALDVRPKDRHLVLEVTGSRLPISGRFLCGHDESHWFVASVPFHRRSATVRGAMEMLKPAAVLREQKRKGVRHQRYQRKTAAYVRQGEWFFLPRPKMQVDPALVERNGRLARAGGKPHRVESLYRTPDGQFTFARGLVSHVDHATIPLDVWHRVVRNNEPEPAKVTTPVMRMAFLD